MNPWMRWRVFADKYNNYLLYCVMGAMTCAQNDMVKLELIFNELIQLFKWGDPKSRNGGMAENDRNPKRWNHETAENPPKS